MTSAEESSPRDRGAILPVAAQVRDFLARLSERLRDSPSRTPLPEEPGTRLRAVTADDDLVTHFATEATAAGCSVHQATAESWIAAVQEILRGHAAKQVVVEPQPQTALTPQRAAALRKALTTAGIAATSGHDDDTLFDADAAVTGVAAAVAETGTLVCASGASSARGTSLIPPVHVALLAASQLVADLFDYFEQLGRWPHLPANVNLITGPSKTADIEGILVTGVHGPGAVHVVLLG